MRARVRPEEGQHDQDRRLRGCSFAQLHRPDTLGVPVRRVEAEPAERGRRAGRDAVRKLQHSAGGQAAGPASRQPNQRRYHRGSGQRLGLLDQLDHAGQRAVGQCSGGRSRTRTLTLITNLRPRQCRAQWGWISPPRRGGLVAGHLDIRTGPPPRTRPS